MSNLDTAMRLTKLEEAKQTLEGVHSTLDHWCERISTYNDAEYWKKETIISQINHVTQEIHRVNEMIRLVQEGSY